MSKTLSYLPIDLHHLILSHDEEKIQLKKENEKLKTRVRKVYYRAFWMRHAKKATRITATRIAMTRSRARTRRMTAMMSARITSVKNAVFW